MNTYRTVRVKKPFFPTIVKTCLSLCLILIIICGQLFAQNINAGDGVNWVGRNQPTPYTQPINGSTAYNVLKYRKVSTTTSNPNDGRGQWVCTINAQSTGGDVTNSNISSSGIGAGFLLTSGGGAGNTGTYANKWAFGGTGTATLHAINGATYSGSTDMGINMSTAGRYTFVMKDAGNTSTGYYVGYTDAAPVTLTHNSASQLAVNADRSATVVATTSATPSTGENVYIRYKLNSADFSSASTSILQATGSSTTWTATIPAQTIGSTVNYYVFTSTMSLSALNALPEADKSYALLNYADNNGATYSYTLHTTFTSIATGNWLAASTWDRGYPPLSGSAVTIASPHVVTIASSAAAASVTVSNGATLTNSSTNAGLVTFTSFTVSNGGTYNHDAIGSGPAGSSSDFPGSTRTFGATSNVVITKWGDGATSPSGTIPNNMGNVSINIAALGGGWQQSGSLTTVQGNLTIQATGGGTKDFRLATATGSTPTCAIGGNLTVSGGILAPIAGGSTGSTNSTVTVAGDIILNGTGTIDANAGSFAGGSVTLNVGGNFSISGSAKIIRSVPVAAPPSTIIVFNKPSGIQTFTSTATGFNANIIAVQIGTGTSTNTLNLLSDLAANTGTGGNITVMAGATLDCTNFSVTAGNTFILSSGANLNIGAANGITTAPTNTGSIQTTTRNFNTAANYAYTGSGLQNTGNGLPALINKLTVANTGSFPNNVVTLTLAAGTAITSNLILATGILNTNTLVNSLELKNTANTAITGGSNSSFISGPITWNLSASPSTTYTFPIGKGGLFMPASVINPTGGATLLGAEAFNGSNSLSPDGTTASAISATEYWALHSTTTGFSSTVSLTRPSAVLPNDVVGYNSTSTYSPGSITYSGTYSSVPSTTGTNTITTTLATGGSTQIFALAQKIVPVITSFDPVVGVAGSTITITGTGFGGATSVSFGGIAASSFTIVNNTTITAVVAGGASGAVTVAAPTGSSSLAGFTFTTGYITKQAGNWHTGATWLGGVVPPASAKATVVHNVLLDANSIINNITLATGGNLALSSNKLTIASGGSITKSGTGTVTGAGSIEFAGTATVNGAPTFDANTTLITKGVVDFNTSTIHGFLQVDVYGPQDFVYGTGSTLVINTGGSYSDNTEWSPTSVPAVIPYHVIIKNNTTYTACDIAYSTEFKTDGNLTIESGSSMIIDPRCNANVIGGPSSVNTHANTLWVQGNLQVGGTLTVQNGDGDNSGVGRWQFDTRVNGNVNIGAAGQINLNEDDGDDLYVGGDWVNDNAGAATNYRLGLNAGIQNAGGTLNYTDNDGRAVIFFGPGNNTIGGSHVSDFHFFFIAKTSGGTLTLNTDAIGSRGMGFTSGLFNLNNHTFTLGCFYDQGGVLNTKGKLYGPGSATSYAYGGTLERYVTNASQPTLASKAGSESPELTQAHQFPMGTSLDYRPFSVTYTAYPSTRGTLRLQHFEVYSADAGTSWPLTDDDGYKITADFKQARWQAAPNASLAGGTYTVAYTCTNCNVPASETSVVRAIKRASAAAAWTAPGVHVATTGSTLSPTVGRSGLSGFSEFGLSGDLTVLPLKLQYMVATSAPAANLINWAVSASSDIVKFEIERSANGTNFTAIGEVAANNQTGTTTYSFSDANTFTTKTYYRLKIIDNNGHITYSGIATINRASSNKPKIVYNPTSNTILLVKADGKYNGHCEAFVVDNAGRLIAKAALANQVINTIQLNNAANGIYTVVVKDMAGNTTEKLAVMR